MNQIFTFFTNVFLLLVLTFLCLGIISAVDMQITANAYKTDIVAEIENSNFNQNVIDQCIAQAVEAGYELEVEPFVYDMDEDLRLAEVVLKYQYKIPILSVQQEKQVRGMAR